MSGLSDLKERRMMAAADTAVLVNLWDGSPGWGVRDLTVSYGLPVSGDDIAVLSRGPR